MNIVKFDRQLWELTSFEEVCYDKKNNLFYIYLFNGSIIEFSEIEEKTIFQFVISTNKEEFYRNVLLPNYLYIQYKNKVSKSS